jgi:uncharacterized membrane protein (DUF485 family)
MTDPRFQAITGNPQYCTLVRSRAVLASILCAAMLMIYFGFILLIAYAPKFLGTPINGGIVTIGIPIGLLVIISALQGLMPASRTPNLTVWFMRS